MLLELSVSCGDCLIQIYETYHLRKGNGKANLTHYSEIPILK